MFKKNFAFRKRSAGDRDEKQDGGTGPVELDVDKDSFASGPQSFRSQPRAQSEGQVSLSSTLNSIDGQLVGQQSKYSSDSQLTQVDKGEEPSEDPLGLKVLHTPPGGRRVDIVFVHGLGGSSRLSWSKNHNLELFWPLKFLPFEPDISEARLLTFGYNASFRPGSGKNKMSVLDFAKDLLYDLKYAKDESAPELEDLMMGERPIIFMVHSMGGLIVKEAYMQGQNDPTYASIIKAVSSIIFLSTPHRGTNLAETLNRILQVSFVSNPMQFIAELANGSQTLQKLNEQFRHVAPKLQIVSFYETRPTKILKKTQIMVLEKDSSVLGYPGEISKPLDADHHGICKYESPDDPRYITVRNVLKSLVGKAKPNIESRKDSRSASTLSFEEYLSVSESPERDYNFFRDQWASGTCNWILEQDAFNSWLSDTRCTPRVLWIHGNAASGKSILSAFVVDHLVQLGLPCQYFYVRFEHKKKQMLSLILRSMACQLANTIPSYAEKLRQIEAAATDLKTADYRNIWQWLYKQCLFQLPINYPLYWVIDGVDEAESPESVVRVLSDLNLTSIPIRVLVLSRQTHELDSAFQKLGKQVYLETLRTEGIREDFLRYIHQELDVAGDDSYKDEIVDKILERARGNFLWVHLAVKRINKCHTKLDVNGALNDLPPGMEALYDRMAHFVQTQPNINHQMLAEIILGWTTCTQRPLSVEELCDALGNEGLLEIHRTIGDLCGGFVVIDKEGKVAMVHATAREYLFRGDPQNRLLAIDKRRTNNELFKRCILRLMEPAVRSQMNRNLAPALLDYATSSWFIHLSQGSPTDPDILEILLKFLRGQYALLWINIAAKTKQLRALVIASRHLTDVALKLQRLGEDESLVQHQAVNIIARWATDLVKIIGKFGYNLSKSPESIHKLIPPFCPEDSAIYQQFGKKEAKTLRISGFTTSTWDDCLTRFSLEEGVIASTIHAAGSYIAILANRQALGLVFIYNSITFEETRRITHPERVFKIQLDKMGERLISYGYNTTRVWRTATGECVKVVKNPSKRPRPQTLLFHEQENVVLVGCEDRIIRSLQIDDNESMGWEVKAHINEQSQDDTVVNAPTCSALNAGGNMIAFGYHGHPVSVWELDPPMLVAQHNMISHETDMTIHENILGEVVQLTWHPFSGEVLGLHRGGLLFRWDPYDEDDSLTVHSGAHYLAMSRDGSLVATGDTVGTVKVYSTADFSLLYQLSSQDSVLHLSFSTDSRRLYDVRGMYGNVWEPGALVRLADSSEYPDHNSDAWSENGSLAKLSLHTQHYFPRVDNVITLSGQSVRPLYCYGTDGGVAVLCEVGYGKVCDLERLSSYMSIEQVAWSGDGRFVAIADLSGRLTLKTIAKEGQDRDTWQVHDNFHVMIPSHNGHISQLLFHPTSHRVFVYTHTALYGIDIGTEHLVESILSPEMPKVKWICHPTLADYLLGFGNTSVHVFSWAKLQEVEVYTYTPQRNARVAAISTNRSLNGRGSSSMAAEECLGRLISHVDSPEILLEVSHLSSSGKYESQYLIFKVADINVESKRDYSLAHDKSTVNSELPYSLLPEEVTSRIREPLAFLSRGRLVFLDINRWICTWRMPPTARRPSAWTSERQGANGIEQYYFLPGDWITSDEAHLCSIMPDGTLLCPRNGDVATVQYAKLRK